MSASPFAVSTGIEAALQLGPLAIMGLLYAKRVRTLAIEGRNPVPGWRQACFYSGFVTIAVALTSLGGASQELLLAHMVEHLLLGDIAALLIVLGLTGPLIAPILRIRFFDRLRILAHPLIAFPLWAIDLYAWHLPVFYQAALRHTGVHALEHAMFLGFGINMWMCLFGPLPMPSWFGNFAKLLYIIAVRLAGTILGQHLPVVGHRVLSLLRPRRRRPPHLSAGRSEHRRGRDDGRGVVAHARSVLLAVPENSARGRGAPGAARLRSGPGSGADRCPRRAGGRGRSRSGAASSAWRAAPAPPNAEPEVSSAHVRRLCDGGGLGRDRNPDLASDPQLQLADTRPSARADDRRDVSGRDRLHDRLQRLDSGDALRARRGA